MNYQNPRRLVLPLAVLFALAACGGQGSGAPEAASGASEAAVQTASPTIAGNAASNAASAASAAVADSNASPEEQELLKRAQSIFKPLPSAEKCRNCARLPKNRSNSAINYGMSRVSPKAIP